MGPFTIEQLTKQQHLDIKARAAQRALVASFGGTNGNASHLLSRLGARLRGRHEPAPVLMFVPRGSIQTMDAVAHGGKAC